MRNCYKIIKSVIDSQIVEAGDSVLLGVSGGVDSVVLLDVLASIREELGLKIDIAHFNYQLRGKASDGDESFVKVLAKKYNCPFFVKQTSPINKTGDTNLQSAARDLRYVFFNKIAQKVGANKIAVAHHADDQAETILLHLTRGSGVNGLLGISAKREIGEGLSLIRPLLSFTKDEILAYAKERKLKFRQDRTNKTKKYQRNAIRHDLLPLVKKYNPNIVQHLCKTATILRDEDRALDEIARAFLQKASPARHARLASSQGEAGGDAFLGDPSYICIKRPIFIKYNPAIMKRVLRLAYARLTGSTADLLTDHLDRMLQICDSSKKEGSYNLPNGVKFKRNSNEILLRLNV